MSATDERAHSCPAVRVRDGKPCQGKQTASGYCFAHDPHANEWRARGGANSSNVNRAAKLLPTRLAPIVADLETAFKSACAGELSTDKGHQFIAPLARAIVTVYQAGELEERLRAIEQRANDAGLFKDRYGNSKGGPIQWPTPAHG